METLFNGFTLDTPPGTFPLSTDSMVLADFVKLGRQASVLDLGSGCATLGVLLCARDPDCRITGVEIDENAHNAAVSNILRNQLSDRLQSICADMANYAANCTPGSYTNCVSNPPYFSGGAASTSTPTARRDDCCSMDALFSAAARVLKWGGSFSLVHRPERLAELCHYASLHNLQPKRLMLVRHHPSSNVSMVLLDCKKGAKPALTIEEISLFDAQGEPTQAYRRIYHL